MNLAMADAAELDLVLGRHMAQGADEDLTAYSEHRLPDISKAQEFSHALIHMMHTTSWTRRMRLFDRSCSGRGCGNCGIRRPTRATSPRATSDHRSDGSALWGPTRTIRRNKLPDTGQNHATLPGTMIAIRAVVHVMRSVGRPGQVVAHVAVLGLAIAGIRQHV